MPMLCPPTSTVFLNTLSASPAGRLGRPATINANRISTPLLTAAADDLSKLPSALAHFEAEVVCVNHQRVYVGSIRTRRGSGATTAVVTPTGSQLATTTPPLLTGLLLDFMPTLSADRTTALLLVRAQWKEGHVDPAAGGTATYRASAATRPASGPSGGSTVSAEGMVPVDRRDGRTHDIRTAARVPVGQMVLIGGATLDPALPTAADGGKSPPRLYLFVEVTAD